MNILICINDAFTELAIQTIRSVHMYNKESLDVYLIYDHLKKKSINKIVSFFNEEKIGNIHCIYYNFKEYDFPMSIPHITKETYFRLYAPFILPSDIDRILYLDCDILCCGSIIDLYNTKFKNNIIVGIGNYDYEPNSSFNIYINKKLGLPPDNPYINAGVLLINLEKYRNFITIEEINNYIDKNYQNLECQDQDVINKLFYSYIKIVPEDYNYQISFIPENELCIEGKKIIHYLDSPKPWEENYCQPFHGITYYRYLYQTEQYDLLNKLLLQHFNNCNLDIYGIKYILDLIY